MHIGYKPEEMRKTVQTHDMVLAKVVGKNIQELPWFLNGFDGNIGHKDYKQRLSGKYSDSDLFLIALVPLQLFAS